MSKDVQRWADVAMYTAEHDISANVGPVHPTVTLISMTARPLQVMAAASELYAGRVVRDAGLVTLETAERWLADMTRTKLQAPLEFIDLHFLIEGVTRAFTHQMVRQRTAVFVQESQRFAVKDNAEFETAMPPTIAALEEDDPRRVLWENAVYDISKTYNTLVNSKIPAEDARSLLPTNITTRLHYKTNLRNLAEHAGMRLCSQAQAEWKQVWRGMTDAMLSYGPEADRWQQRAIVGLFKPVCYQTGRCEFRADTDRWCSIRSRVEAHFAAGEGPDAWSDINPLEPLRQDAARLDPEVADHVR